MHINVIDAIVKGVLVGLFMAISVGPTLFAVIKYSINYSYKAGLAFVLGVSLSDIMFVTIANIAARWLELLKPYERYIAFGGGGLLMIMGLAGLIRKQKQIRPDSTSVAIKNSHYAKIFISGFLVNTLNPGALITWLGAVTLIANTTAWYRVILFGTCLIIILSIDFSKVFLAEKIKRFLTAKRIVYVQKFSSICLFLIGTTILIGAILNTETKKTDKKSSIDKILSLQIPGKKDKQLPINYSYHRINLSTYQPINNHLIFAPSCLTL
jgi:threonine/homoserine/homoserine lactone efflux protein